MTTDPKDEVFLERWSRRKRGLEDSDAAEESETGEPAAPGGEATDPEQAVAEPETDAEILDRLKLPEPETLGSGDDFKRFMRGEVPARLRNRALRRLWATNPLLAGVDDLWEYGEDFTDKAKVVENLQTVYQVGRGMVRKLLEAEDEEGGEAATVAGRPDAPAEDAETVAEAPAPEAEPAEAESAEAEPSEAEPAEPAATDAGSAADAVPPRRDTRQEDEAAGARIERSARLRRRGMTFRFDEA